MRLNYLKENREAGKHISLPEHRPHAFVNSFQLADLFVFDQENLCRVLADRVLPVHLALSLHGAPRQLVQRCLACIAAVDRPAFLQALAQPEDEEQIEQARHLLLDRCFWELTYWKTPEMYDELISGERLHPGIFQQLEPFLAGKVVLDSGAGSGRASFEAVKHGAALVYAVEPSPGLRRLLKQKIMAASARQQIVPLAGDFAHLPLPTESVDLALACSAFTAEEGQGGEAGLTDLKRVTRRGGYLVLIWPQVQDRAWLVEHGFHYVALPMEQEMAVEFSSRQSALRCASQFYAQNKKVLPYLLQTQQSCLPFSVLGFNAPCDYAWLQVI
jgi:ubiquinone/menaquinone biosynthesis C-methylase UbiE